MDLRVAQMCRAGPMSARVELHSAAVKKETGNRHDDERNQEHISRRQKRRTEKSNQQRENASATARIVLEITA